MTGCGDSGPAGGRELVSGVGGVLEVEDFVFYSELLALQVSEGFNIGHRSADLLIDGLLQAAVTGPEGLDTILQRQWLLL
jgi:hypothetical protein